MKSIFCVLKTGMFDGQPKHKRTQYTQEHVIWLKRQCQKFAPDNMFFCLSDVYIKGVHTIPLEKKWPGWWAKLELFRFENVFYIDLDTVIIKNIYHMMNLDGFWALDSLSGHRRHDGSPVMGSGIMSWTSNDNLVHLYKNFDVSKIKEYVTPTKWGDQGYIRENVNSYNSLQSAFPDEIISYKFNNIEINSPPNNVSIVVFHGKPKPWEKQPQLLPWVPKFS